MVKAATILANQRGVECARERGSRQDMLAHCAVFPTVEERDAFLAGYYTETRRIAATREDIRALWNTKN